LTKVNSAASNLHDVPGEGKEYSKKSNLNDVPEEGRDQSKDNEV
jgi:hypothetical protein